ncbi:MAG: LPS export ABC transporter periplasmic protein LptC [Pseudomonadota bacterium]
MARRPNPRIYSRFVRMLRIGLPLVALALLSTLFLFERDDTIGGIVFSRADLAALGAGMRLTEPRIAGMTEKGEPFLVTADWALPDGPDPDEITLQGIEAEIDMADGRKVRLTSDRALLLRRDETLTLFDNIRMTSSDGYVVTTERATAHMATGRIEVTSPVLARGPLGQISADRFRAERAPEEGDGAGGTAGDKVWFEGRVRLIYLPGGDAEGSAE